MAITDNLVAQWDINTRGRTDDDFYDHVNSAAETSTNSPTLGTFGGGYDGLTYNGTDSCTPLTWPAGLSSSFTTSAFTMAVRFKHPATAQNNALLAAGSPSAFAPNATMYVDANEKSNFRLYNDSSSVTKFALASSALTTDVEHVMVVTHNGSGAVKHYIDGTQMASVTGWATSGVSGLSKLTLGAFLYSSSAYFGQSTIMWAAIWDTDLSLTDIETLDDSYNPFDISPEVSIDDDTPAPGQTVTITATPDFAGAITGLEFPNGETVTPSSASASEAVFVIPAKSSFLLTATHEDTPWNEALVLGVTDGTETRNITVTITPATGSGIYTGTTGATPYPADTRLPTGTVAGDYYYVEYLTGVGTFNEYGVASQSELPASMSVRVWHEATSKWSGEYIYNFALTDTTPSTYSIPDITDAEVSNVYTSDPFTPAGYNSPTTISIVGGTYSINGGIYTSSSGSLTPGDSLRVRLTSSSSYNTTVTATTTIGGVTSDFNVTTKALSYDVNPFTITPVTGVTLNTGVESELVYPTGYNVPVPVSIINGQFSIDGDAYTSAVTDITVGSNIKVKAISSSQYDTKVTAILTIGDQSANFEVTTEAAQLIPDTFSFPVKTNIPISTAAVTSDPIAVTGINSTVPVFISGSASAQYSKNDGDWTSAAGIAEAGDIFRVRVNASDAYSTQTSASLTIGGVTATFSVTTLTETQAVTGGYKVKLETVDSGYMTTELLNDNMTKVQDNLNDKVLYRLNPDGTPNEMNNNLDMNSYRILNLPTAVSTREPVTLGQALDILGTDQIPVYGYAESAAIWYKASNGGSWSPTETFIDVNVSFVKANAVISTVVVRAILDTNTGNINATSLSVTGEIGTVAVLGNNTPAPRITVTHTGSGVTVPVLAAAIQGGSKGDDGADGAAGSDGQDGVTTLQYYIRPVYGTAIKNGTGTLTIQARVLSSDADDLLSEGDVKLYVGGTEVTEANGYATGSDAYTGVFDSGDINDSVLVELKDIIAGVTYDSITLIDVQDGVASNATTGSVAPSNGLAWRRAKNDGSWVPAQAYTDLVATFYQGGSVIATETRRVTLNTSDGTLTEALQGANDANIDVTTTGSATGAITVSFEHTPSGHVIAETVISVLSGNDGSDGSDGSDGADGENATLYYIKPTNGTAIKNGVGTLTIEARKVDGSSDTLLSSGTIKLYSGSTELTQANGFVSGSDGYTGVLDAGDIDDSIVIELKNGPSGTVLDTITLVDITDGIGSNATTGSIAPSNGLAWNRAANAGAWSPGVTTTDLVATFYQGGVAVASETQRVTLNTSAGTLTSAMTGANHADISVDVTGSGTNAITVLFTHVPSGAKVSEQVIAVQGGSKGDTGNAGTPGADAVLYYIKPTTGTAIKNGVGTLRVEAHKIVGGTDTLLSTGTIKLFVGTTEVTTGNGYATGSTGYVGVFDAGDINESVVVTMKDGANGTALDTITLIDVTDGTGSNATYGSVAPSAGLAWVKATGGAWSPTNTFTDLVCTFYQGGSAVATETRRVTLNTSTGTLTSALQGADNTSITASVVGSATNVLTVTFTHTPSGAKVSETVVSQIGTGTVISRDIADGNTSGVVAVNHTAVGNATSVRVRGTFSGTAFSAPTSPATFKVRRGTTDLISVSIPISSQFESELGAYSWQGIPLNYDFEVEDTPAAGTYSYNTTWSSATAFFYVGPFIEVIEYVSA